MTKREKILLMIILAAAVFLRLAAVDFGLPYHESFGDEIVHIIAGFRMLADKSFRADYDFYYLPPLLAYLSAPIFALIGLFGILIGKFQNIADYQHFVLLYREVFLSVPRVISAIFGAASIYFLFLLAKKLFDKKIAFLASVFLAFDFVHLHESQTGHIWAPLAFFTLAAFYYFLRVYETGEKKWYVWSALMIGLGYGMGQIPLVYYLPFLLVHIFSRPKTETLKQKIFHKNFLIATILILAIFALFTYLNTYSFFKHFFSDVAQPLFRDLGFKTASLPSAAEASVSFLSYNFKTIAAAIFYDNPLILIAAILGSLIIFKKYKPSDLRSIFLIFFPLAYFISFALLFYQFMFLYRYVLVASPFLLITAAYFVFWLGDKISNPRAGKIILAVLIILMVGYSSIGSVLYTFKLRRGYTLSQGIEWVYKNIPAGSRIVSGTYLTPNKESLEFLKTHNQLNWFDTRKSYLMSLNDIDYPKPSYFILNPVLTDLSTLSDKEKTADYIFVAFFDYNDEAEKSRKEFFGFVPGGKELIKKIYPADRPSAGEKIGVPDLINYQPHFFLKTLFKIKYLGPNVEIYRVLK